MLHVRTNETPYKSSEEVLVELLQLKDHIESILPGTTVILSQPTIRADNSKANYTIKQLITKLNNLNIKVMDNTNIHDEHLGKKGLHLNGRGTGKLALNIMSLIRHL